MNSTCNAAIAPSLMIQHIDLFACPACSGSLAVSQGNGEIKCNGCGQIFGCEDGIPSLFWQNEWESPRRDVTDTIKSFYEKTPFPDYEEFDSRWSFKKKAQKGIFANLLDTQIPEGSKVLEAGCGTGQLSNFLGMKQGRLVFGTDMCMNSLKLGQEFKEKNRIQDVAFFQMNLFRPAFKPESFDIVICNGVLHHTSDPFLGFRSIVKLLKPGGFIIIGLYNSFGRIPTDIKRVIFGLSGNRFKSLDSYLRNEKLGEAKKRAWFMDQYKNPHESKHTFGEALSWFDRCGIEFINSVPKSTPYVEFSPSENLFKANHRGTKLDHLCVQLNMLLKGGREGGFFTVIGLKKDGK